MKKLQIQILGVLLLMGSCFTLAYAASVDVTIKSVKMVDKNTVSATLAAPIDGDTFTGDAKVLKDLTITSVTKNKDNAKLVNVVLGTDLLPNTSYSILSIFGAEGNMDFTLKDTIKNAEFPDSEAGAAIDKVVVRDARDIDIYYKLNLASNEIEYKVLSNLGVDTIKKDTKDTSNIVFTLKTPLEPKTGYILMMVNLKNSKGADFNFSEGIYDFATDAFGSTSGSGATVGTGATSKVSLKTGKNSLPGGSKLVDLNSAKTVVQGSETGTGTNTDSGAVQGNLTENVASSASSTPPTGSETWVLILGTLIINTVFFYSRRKNGKKV